MNRLITNDKDLANKKIGYRYLATLSILLIIAQLAFFKIAESDPEELVVEALLISIPLIFVFLGKKWAKWATSIISFFYGVISIIGSFYLGTVVLFIVGAFQIYFGATLHFSQKVKAVFHKSLKVSKVDKDIRSKEKSNVLDYPISFD